MGYNGFALQDLMSFDNDVKSYIKDNEGYRSDIYADTKKIPTTGYGFNIKAAHIRKWIPADVLSGRRGLRREESDSIFEKVYSQAVSDARQYLGGKVFDNLPNQQKKVVIDMSYNMGLTSLNKFQNMREALIKGDMKWARSELLDSDYAREDVPNRANRNADLMYPDETGLKSLASKPQSDFKQAFAQARRAGKKIFEFNNKLYTTEVK